MLLELFRIAEVFLKIYGMYIITVQMNEAYEGEFQLRKYFTLIKYHSARAM